MEKFFKLKANNTTVRTEVIAGLTTFFTMAYIIFVNPSILSLNEGMPWGGIFVATILASVVGTLVMGLVSNVPYAQAPGMGLNAFFTFTVCGQMGFHWQEALALVFFCGLLNIFITVTKFRKSIIRSIPSFLQNAISGGIGLFIAYIGVKNSGFLSFTSDPGRNIVLDNGTVIADSSIVPGLVAFSAAGPLLALIGLIITVILLVKQVKGAIFISIILTTIIGIPMGLVSLGDVKIFDLTAVDDIKDTAFVLFGNPGIGSIFNSPEKIFLTLVAIFAFSLTDTFDTIGTFVGTGRVSGIFDDADEETLLNSKGFNSKMERALFADAFATTTGAMLGTSNVTTFVESASGISLGGRTGLTSVVVAAMFLLCLPFAGLFGIVPAEATAPALIVIGVMMMSSFGKIKWNEFDEATPAFMTAIIMTFAYNISYGIAAGFMFYCIIKAVKGQMKEVHPILIGATFLFLLNFAILALRSAGIL